MAKKYFDHFLIERGIGTAYSTVSRLSQANAGEFFEQARDADSSLLRVGDMARLIAILPPRFTVQKLEKTMSTAKHGYSLRSGFYLVCMTV